MRIKLLVAQLEFDVGDFEQNFRKIKDAYVEAENNKFDFVITPELSISGYPPKDLLLRNDFLKKKSNYLKRLKEITVGQNCMLCVGSPYKEKKKLFNSVLIFRNGEISHRVDKTILPNYGVFDEKRYFEPSKKITNFIKFKEKKICFLICEDFWNIEFMNKITKMQPDLIIIINASPYEKEKYQNRIKLAESVTKKANSSIIYVNLTNAQDDLVFDGGSFYMSNEKKILYQAPFFLEHKMKIDYYTKLPFKKIERKNSKKKLVYSHIYKALVYSLRKYLKKNRFEKVIIGISGGIDSALSACIACDAVSPKNVQGYILPSKYTSVESIEDAKRLAEQLSFSLKKIEIESILKHYHKNLDPLFSQRPKGITEENLQSRVRANLLMSLSNKFNQLLITTGNKSELAVGYSTLYGDMCGGFSILKDLYKTEVYNISKWRNENNSSYFLVNENNLIPENILEKEPTAELRFNQRDRDTLPPYEILDKILYYLVDKQMSKEEIVNEGFKGSLVEDVWMMLKKSEFKRYQSVLGPKISGMSFDNDRRYPIVNDYVV